MPEIKDVVIIFLVITCLFMLAGVADLVGRPSPSDVKRGWFEMEGKLYIVTPAEAILHVSK